MKKQEQKHTTGTEGSEMGEKQMMQLLVELADTIYWQAIKKWNRKTDGPLVGGLVTLDPFKEPTKVARTQGYRNGLFAMEISIDEETEERKEESNKNIK